MRLVRIDMFSLFDVARYLAFNPMGVEAVPK